MNPISYPQRCFAAVLLAATAGIHIALVPEHLREAPYAGVLFIALSAAALMLAILLIVRSELVVWTMSAALVLSALLAYIASRSIGLPSLEDDVGDWLNPLGIAALGVEAVAVLQCAMVPALRRGDARGLLEA
jgi:uncharacterized membrane protein YdfJ with MMPL/SSD domain